jgi:hypothetical protein
MGSLLDTIKTNVVSLFGNNDKPKSNEEAVLGYQPNISPLPPASQAGDASTTGESVASDVAVDNTSALGEMATDVSTTTTTTTPAPPVVTPTAPAVPVAPTGNTYSFEGDAATKGTSGDVKSQAMYDLAQEALNRGDMRGAEAILRRPLTNQDYFPGPGLQQARTAWGDPLFTGAGQLFPMAVMDARQKAMAEAEAMAMREEALNFEIPKIEVAGLRSRVQQGFVERAEAFSRNIQSRAGAGGARNAIREAKRSGEWAKFMAQEKAIADAINYTGKQATDFLTNAQKAQETGDSYADPMALKAAQDFTLGINRWGNGEIGNEDLNQLASQFKLWESWGKYEKDARSRIKPTDITAAEAIAQQGSENPTQEDIAAYNAVKLNLPGSTRDMKAWLYNKKVSQVLASQYRQAVVDPFFANNRSAVQQFQESYPDLPIEEIKDKIAEQYAMGYGRQVEGDKIVQTPKASSTTNIPLPGDKPGEIYYQDVFTRTGEIVGNTQGIVKTLNKQNATGQQRIDLAKNSFREMFRKISNKGEVTNNYMGYEPIKVQTYDIKSAPVPYNEYKKYNPKTRMYEPMTPADFGFTEKDAQARFENSRPEGNPVLNKLELVMLQPDGSTIPWDGKNVPAETEIYVAMTHSVDVEKPGMTGNMDKIPAKTKTALTIAPLSQMGKQLDDLFQRLSKNELESKSQGGAFKFDE